MAPRRTGGCDRGSPPNLAHSPMFILNQSESGVPERDQCSTVRACGQPILHIRDKRIGREKWTYNFEQCRPFDGLHVSPEMAIVAA